MAEHPLGGGSELLRTVVGIGDDHRVAGVLRVSLEEPAGNGVRHQSKNHSPQTAHATESALNRLLSRFTKCDHLPMLSHDVTWKSSFVKVGWAPMGVVLFHSAYGWLIGHPPALDLVMHPLGGLAIAYAAHVAIPRLQPLLGSLTRTAHYFLVLGASFVCANLWEYAEFFADLLVDSRIQTSVEETMVDLVLGTGAATVFVALSWARSGGAGLAPDRPA